MDYKKAGVDIEAGYKSVELMNEHVKKPLRPEVGRTGAVIRYRRMWNKGQTCHDHG